MRSCRELSPSVHATDQPSLFRWYLFVACYVLACIAREAQNISVLAMHCKLCLAVPRSPGAGMHA